jgi:hypothetical protein
LDKNQVIDLDFTVEQRMGQKWVKGGKDGKGRNGGKGRKGGRENVITNIEHRIRKREVDSTY